MKLYNIYEILNLLIIRILMIRNMFNFNIIIIDNNNRIKKMNKKQKKRNMFECMSMSIFNSIQDNEWNNYRYSLSNSKRRMN